MQKNQSILESKLKPNTEAVFISSRIRLARNFADDFFVGNSTPERLRETLYLSKEAILTLPKFEESGFCDFAQIDQSQREILFENNLISSELLNASRPRGLCLDGDCTSGIMINEEDHLRIQVFESGLCLEALWKKIDKIDNALSKKIPYAYSAKYGYLTACPTNVGTGMRASVMMHLPALCITGQIDQITRGLNHLGIVVRGLHGEGSESCGDFYQISNQQTLGMSEQDLIQKISKMCANVARFEENARMKILEEQPEIIYDKFSRAWASIFACRIITSAEATECLSDLRLASDMGFMPAKLKTTLDALLIVLRKAHLERDFGEKNMSDLNRDILRAQILKEVFKNVKAPTLPKFKTKRIKTK